MMATMQQEQQQQQQQQQKPVDAARVAVFFNDLELDQQDDYSDLELLLEAERRGLLSDETKQLLYEARIRGFVPPLNPKETFSAYLTSLGGFSMIFKPTVDSAVMSSAVSALMKNRNETDLNVHFKVHVEHLSIKPEGERGAKAAKLYITLPSIHTIAVFDNVFVVLCKCNARDTLALQAHVFRGKDKKKTKEVADAVARACRQAQTDLMQISREDSPVVTVKLQRGPEGYGFRFIGPASAADPSGIFITSVKEGSPAAESGLIKKGQQILSINNINLEDTTIMDARAILKRCDVSVTMELQDNPLGYATYEARQSDKKPGVHYKGAPYSLDSAIDSVMGDLLSLASDMSYKSSVTMVGRKAVPI